MSSKSVGAAVAAAELEQSRVKWAFLLLGLVGASLLGWIANQLLGGHAGQPAYFLLGVAGAIFANSTGAGGGVVFIPTFNQLGFSEWQAVGTSIGIQCFGMTAGAIAWSRYYATREAAQSAVWRPFLPAVLLSAVPSVAGIWLVYGLDIASPASLHEAFKVFSLVLGAGILATILLLRPAAFRQRLAWLDVAALVMIGLGGGMITAWLSVGVGELIALYLILRRFDVTLSVAVAVVISALSVWSALPEHTLVSANVHWDVVSWAGPGAIIGAVLARALATRLSSRGLKGFFGFWLLVIGVFG